MNKVEMKNTKRPLGIDEDFSLQWGLALWRSQYYKQLSIVRKMLLFRWLKINAVAILSAVLLGRLIYLNTTIDISAASLSTLSIGIMTASAAILTIITAFLIFWFGSAINNLKNVRDNIDETLVKLDEIIAEVRPWEAGPKEEVTGDLRKKVIHLADLSKKFRSALMVLAGRFYRAGIGTYYDSTSMYRLDSVVKNEGGKWFVAYARAFEGFEARDYCMKIWEKAEAVSRRLGDLNRQSIRASGQLKQIVEFIPTLISVLLVFAFALLVSFLSGITYGSSILLPLTKIILSLIMIILIVVHLGSLVQYLWSLVSSKYLFYEANRIVELENSKALEKQYKLDYHEALIKDMEVMMQVIEERKDTES
ncbi:hypothetical protein ACFLXG_03115 [Chloroflexota bacterium]